MYNEQLALFCNSFFVNRKRCVDRQAHYAYYFRALDLEPVAGGIRNVGNGQYLA
jgi:hypothetical protein